MLFISITAPDRLGLIAAITGRLFELGANLDDTTFAVLGTSCEFGAVCHLPTEISLNALTSALFALPLLEGAKINVEPFEFEPDQAQNAQITHRIKVSGGDRPGFIARLTEVFLDYDANIVRMNSVRITDDTGADQYVTRFAVSIPLEREASCLAAIDNTAGQLSCRCSWSRADGT